MASLAEAVAQLSEMLGELDGEPVALEGGITNRNYRARFGDEDLVIRLPGKDTDQLGVDRAAERDATEAAAAAGVGPEVVALLEDPLCLVTRFIVGEPVSADQLHDPTLLAEVAEALRRVHEAGAVSGGFSPFRVVEDYAGRAVGRGGSLPGDYDWAREVAAGIEAELIGPEHEPVLCHDDLLSANFLRTAEGIRIVDWEYAGMGDRYFDLGNLAVNNGLDAEDEVVLLESYFGEAATPERLRGLHLMRFMSDFREAMWGVLQGTLSDLDFDFASYADEHFERMRRTAGEVGLASG